MGVKQQLGQKIRRIRILRGLTQEQLSEMIDISQRTLSVIENGDNFLTAETLDKFVKALNVSIRAPEDLYKDIIRGVILLKDKPKKLEFLYKIVQSLNVE